MMDLDYELDKLQKRMTARDDQIRKCTEALEALADKVVNLANRLDAHLKERDAHNPGTMR
jgi:predicted  nucleic acid-binding Zn-ribbon protein